MTGVVARQLHLNAQPFLAFQRKQLVIHLESRLQRKAVHRGDVGEETKVMLGEH